MYGLTDASRLWYLRVHKELLRLGLENLKLDEAVYIWKQRNVVQGILCIHVDDFMWCGNDEFKRKVIDEFVKIFRISRQTTGSFTYLGLRIRQLADKIVVDQQHYVDSIEEP